MTEDAFLNPVCTITLFNNMWMPQICPIISIVPIISIELNLDHDSIHFNLLYCVDKFLFRLLPCLLDPLMEVKWDLINYTICHVAHVDGLKLLGVYVAYTNEARFDH